MGMGKPIQEALSYRLSKILGLDPHEVVSIKINIELESIVTAEITKQLNDTELSKIVNVMEEFELHEKQKAAPSLLDAAIISGDITP